MALFEPLFIHLPGAVGTSPAEGARRFALLHRPAGLPRGLVVYAPPLAEEMNKARRMAALQARALAAAGHAVLQPDLLGCGDSPGTFGEATWAAWVHDVVGSAQWLRQAFTAWHPGHPLPPLTLWGLRAGALLAAEAATALGDVARLLLWQPAPAGKPLLQQFLRLAVAAELGAEGGPRTRTEDLRQSLLAGQAVEVAGYTLAPALAAGLDAARLAPVPGLSQLVWLECSPREEPALLPASLAALDAWRAAGAQVQARAVRGPAFWQTTEIEDAPALVEATLACLDEDPGTGPGSAQPARHAAMNTA